MLDAAAGEIEHETGTPPSQMQCSSNPQYFDLAVSEHADEAWVEEPQAEESVVVVDNETPETNDWYDLG